MINVTNLTMAIFVIVIKLEKWRETVDLAPEKDSEINGISNELLDLTTSLLNLPCPMSVLVENIMEDEKPN